MTGPVASLADLDRAALARLVPEYLLAGHLIDRAGMPHLIAAFGREVMRDIAIDEWMGASPIYTKRMQRALDFEGTSVTTIFKGMQLDIGAPPQFMDFRYRVDSDDRGEFWLDHCGALMDVEPMGDEYVVTMCHDIEDPTFDATAIATNPRAQVRPVHRPPRLPADRSPHCHWTVAIDERHPALPVPEAAEAIGNTEAATIELSPIGDDPSDDDGRRDYAGPLLADLRFDDWAADALVRMAEEICLQGHLLALSFERALGARADAEQTTEIVRQQFTGAAGLAARRIRSALGLADRLDDAAAVLALHPALLPHAYVGAVVELDDRLVVRLPGDSPARRDGGWIRTLDAQHLGPLDAAVREVDPRFRCLALDDGDDLVLEVVVDDQPAAPSADVALAAFSTGADFTFEDRGIPVEITPRSP